MKRNTTRPIAAIFIALLFVAAPVLGQQQKLAQTGMKFLSASLDPKAAALGDAVTAADGGSEMLFYNPAGMASQATFMTASFGQLNWIADINYNQASVSFAPKGGRYGVIGFSMLAVDYGELQGTIRADNERGYLDTEIFSPSAFGFGIGYARALTDRFSVGGHAKFVDQDLGASAMDYNEGDSLVFVDNQKGVTAFDFGVLYRTGFKSLTFAFSARNFAKEIKYVDESFQLPLTLKIGLRMNVFDLTSLGASGMHRLNVSVDAENPRDFSEQIKVGAEYVFLDSFALRAGYVVPTDQQGINLGAGFYRTVAGVGVGADYAYTDFGIFQAVHRFALRISL